ncbi:hypothetical protein [[Phormidium ambiguum] IAM M-71]|uniref:hypothetical protein n=1 Tax=[Phormidium ambiguum] IAM M-71 TaxID=454136 RepID=UPI001C4A596F|nr:hypothetical protein [Phormidium ambiguum]
MAIGLNREIYENNEPQRRRGRRGKREKIIAFTQMIDTNGVGAGLAKSLEYPAIRLKSKPAHPTNQDLVCFSLPFYVF